MSQYIKVKLEPKKVSVKNMNVPSVPKSKAQHSRTNSNPKSARKLSISFKFVEIGTLEVRSPKAKEE